MGALVIGASRTDVTANDSVAFARAIGNQIVQTLQLSKSVASLSASEQRYRTLLDRASDAIAVLGTDGVVREVNQRWERLLMRRRDEIVGRRMSEFAAPGRADETLAASTGPDAADGSAIPVELLRADGATVRVELSAAHLDVNGERVVLTIGRDVTEQHRLEEQLRQAQKLEAIGQLAHSPVRRRRVLQLSRRQDRPRRITGKHRH